MLRHPERVGGIEIPLEDVLTLSYLRWWRRATYGISVMPGMAVIELSLADGNLVRFTDVQKSLFEKAIQDAAEEFPALLTSRQ